MNHQAFGRLGLDEPYLGPGDPLTDGFGVGGIVLLPIELRLHMGRRLKRTYQ